jgi:hypothetical protein
MPRKYIFKTTPAFRTALRKLTPRQKASARNAFDIDSDLRAIFYVEGDLVVSLDIGDHAIYRN